MSDFQMNSVKVTNVYEGVLLLGQDESMLLSVGNAEKLRDDLSECVLTASGHTELTRVAEEIELGEKFVLNGNLYTVKNILSGISDSITVQAEDYFGVSIELSVPEDFELTVRERIE